MPGPTYSVIDIANYFLALVDPEVDRIDHLKLQKLVYYAQGFHLALTDRALFSEPIEAWTHGPVCPDLYHRYKEFGKETIPYDPTIETAEIDESTRAILDEVWEVYGQFTGWKLRNITHAEPTWQMAFHRPNKLITTEEMRSYFKTQIEA